MVRTSHPSETHPRDESRAFLTLGGDLPAAHDARDGHARRGGRAGRAWRTLARAQGSWSTRADGAPQLTPPPGRQSAGPGEPHRRITLAAHEARGDRRALRRVRARPPAAGLARWSSLGEFCWPSPCGRPPRNSTSRRGPCGARRSSGAASGPGAGGPVGSPFHRNRRPPRSRKDGEAVEPSGPSAPGRGPWCRLRKHAKR